MKIIEHIGDLKPDPHNRRVAGQWRNRIIGHGEENPEQLLANPRNYRIHPKAQQDALLGVIKQVGIVDEIIVNQATGFVINGHLRAAMAISEHQATVPVKYVDLTDEEEALILATFDPLAAMAATDKQQLDALLREVSSEDAALQAMLAELAEREGLLDLEDDDIGDKTLYEQAIQLKPPREYVVVMCEDAAEWDALKARLQLKEVRRGGYRPGSQFDHVGTERVITVSRLLEILHADSSTEQGASGQNNDTQIIAFSDAVRTRG